MQHVAGGVRVRVRACIQPFGQVTQQELLRLIRKCDSSNTGLINITDFQVRQLSLSPPPPSSSHPLHAAAAEQRRCGKERKIWPNDKNGQVAEAVMRRVFERGLGFCF